MTELEQKLLSIITEISSSRKMRVVGDNEYWDAYVSTNDIYVKNRQGRGSYLLENFYTVPQIRKICDKIVKLGLLIKVKNGGGCYARYCCPLSDNWEMHGYNLYRKTQSQSLA